MSAIRTICDFVRVPLQAVLFFYVYLFFTSVCLAENIERLGEAYVVYLPKEANFKEVVADVKTEIGGINWQVVGELDIGEAVKELDVDAENKVISVCNIQYLSQAVQADPMISLIIPCRFTVFREKGGERRIVVGFYDPVAEAVAINLKSAQAAEVASKELQTVLERIAEIYQ